MYAQLLAWPVHFFDFIGFSHSYAHPQMVISVLGRVQSSNGCPTCIGGTASSLGAITNDDCANESIEGSICGEEKGIPFIKYSMLLVGFIVTITMVRMIRRRVRDLEEEAIAADNTKQATSGESRVSGGQQAKSADTENPTFDSEGDG